MEKYWRAFREGTLRAVAFHFTITYVLPIGLPLVTGWLGYVQELPLMYIFVAVLVAFAATATGMLRFDEWLARRRVEGKIVSAPAPTVPIHNQGFVLGINLHNHAAFPIEVELTELRTEIGSKVPADKTYRSRKNLILAPDSPGHFYDNPIVFEIPKPGGFEGFLEAKLKYGPMGSELNYKLEIKKQITARFNETGQWVGNAIWTDIIGG